MYYNKSTRNLITGSFSGHLTCQSLTNENLPKTETATYLIIWTSIHYLPDSDYSKSLNQRGFGAPIKDMLNFIKRETYCCGERVLLMGYKLMHPPHHIVTALPIVTLLVARIDWTCTLGRILGRRNYYSMIWWPFFSRQSWHNLLGCHLGGGICCNNLLSSDLGRSIWCHNFLVSCFVGGLSEFSILLGPLNKTQQAIEYMCYDTPFL